MKFRGNIQIGSFCAGFGGVRWRIMMTRGVTAWEARLGPFYIRRSGLPFSNEAAKKVFDVLNHPDSPTRKMADLYRNRG